MFKKTKLMRYIRVSRAETGPEGFRTLLRHAVPTPTHPQDHHHVTSGRSTCCPLHPKDPTPVCPTRALLVL